MLNMSKYYFLILLLVMCACDESASPGFNDNDFKLFEQISSSKSNITFSNSLKENFEAGFNVLDFDFFYNGAGVGVGDFDNDGLEDIVFAANQGLNRIYKNLGNFEFEDRTESSGINKGKYWSNGVSIIDFNHDGLLDIYISQGGPFGPEKRKNLLFINKGNFEFDESAEKYNLSDKGISTQTVFFDFDKDNDLDCFVLNESPLIGQDPINFYKLINNHSETLLPLSTSHLYRNDNGSYKDITQNTDINKPSFGLGVCVSDINDDGWLDIYVTNDYYVPDALYINDQNGNFIDQTEELTNQISFFGMGVDIADINNDGYKDIYVLDMASDDHIRAKTLMESMDVANFRLLTEGFNFPFQYMFNSLQLNNGNGKFDNVAQAYNIGKTDWSWAGLLADFDLDGDKDIFVTNGYRRYAKDNDFRKKVSELQSRYNGEVPLEEKKKLYFEMPSEKLPNVYYTNSGKGNFNIESEDSGLDSPSFSNGAAYADFDNDGDLDLVINNIDQEAFLYKNLAVENGRNNFLKIVTDNENSNSFFKATIKVNESIQHLESKKIRGYLSSCTNEAIFGLANNKIVDELKIDWSDGTTQIFHNLKVPQVLEISKGKSSANTIKEKPSNPKFKELKSSNIGLEFKHNENKYDDFAKEVLLPFKQSTLGPFISVDDINKDGNTDFYISGAKGQNGNLFISNSNGTYTKNKLINQNKLLEEMKAAFIDFDNDGEKDMYIPSGGNSESVPTAYIDQAFNNKSNNFHSFVHSFDHDPSAGKIAIALDFDNDGDEDLFIGNKMKIQSYPLPSNSYLYENIDGKFFDVTNAKFEQINFGMVNDVISTDVNNDGWSDLIIVGEWNYIQIWVNQNGKFINNSASLLDKKLTGWWNKIVELDINNDGKKDYLIGNLGLNAKYKASDEKPLTVYVNDFDSNGSLDFVLSKKYNDKEVPFRGKECSSEQMPFISEKYESYSSFAQASMKDIFGDKLENSKSISCNEFSSIVLIQNQDGTFKTNFLPVEAQLRPMLDAVTTDLNNDGFMDIVAVGNIYNTEPETPRLDFHNATVLISNKNDNFYFDHELSTQLEINGNSKSIEILKRKNLSDLLVISINDGNLKVFEIIQ